MIEFLNLPELVAIGLGFVGALGGVIVGLLRSQSARRSQGQPGSHAPPQPGIALAVDEINRSAAQQMDQIDQASKPRSAAMDARLRRKRGRTNDQ